MKCLIYCIFQNKGSQPENLPRGIDGGTVSLLSEGELAAAYSTVPNSLTMPTLDQAKAYARVVDALHRTCTLLPMRYGSVLETEDQVAELLRTRRAEFLARLRELDGSVEMGIRIMLTKEQQQARSCESPCSRSAPCKGAAYLQARQRHYAEVDWYAQAACAQAERYKAAFDGLFIKCRMESSLLTYSTAGAAFLSLYFLVKRDCQEPFRRTFRELSHRESAKILLSGPWPPYNFVEPLHEKGR